jgi:hypothetical protein
MTWKILGSATLLVILAGCAKNGTTDDDAVHVRGTIGQDLNTPDARAVAVAGDGRWFSTAIDTHGAFDLVLPKGVSYRVVITQGNTIVARVVLAGGQGQTVWINGRDPGTVSFGLLRASSSITTKTVGEPEAAEHESGASGASGESGEAEDSKTEGDDEHGDKDSYSACSSGDEKELEPTNPAAGEKSDYGEKDDDEKEQACTPKT